MLEKATLGDSGQSLGSSHDPGPERPASDDGATGAAVLPFHLQPREPGQPLWMSMELSAKREETVWQPWLWNSSKPSVPPAPSFDTSAHSRFSGALFSVSIWFPPERPVYMQTLEVLSAGFTDATLLSLWLRPRLPGFWGVRRRPVFREEKNKKCAFGREASKRSMRIWGTDSSSSLASMMQKRNAHWFETPAGQLFTNHF